MRTIIGIDPGMKGAIAVVTSGVGRRDVRVHPLPHIGKELDHQRLIEMLLDPLQIHQHVDQAESFLAVIEKVHSMPRQGVASSFKFGRQYGEILGILAALEIHTVQVTPQAWKKKVLAGQNWKGDKKASIQYVQRRYPKLSLLPTPRSRVPSDGMADAVCIALWAM